MLISFTLWTEFLFPYSFLFTQSTRGVSKNCTATAHAEKNLGKSNPSSQHMKTQLKLEVQCFCVGMRASVMPLLPLKTRCK